jgi:REP element-mobilizing transposase RayT
MFLTPFSNLAWSYRLHYYLCFRTHRRRELFTNELYANSLAHLIEEISNNHDYHLLEQKSYPTQLRCLLSLRPSQSISEAVRLLKCNSARELAQQFNITVPVWATGYLARSSGGVRTSEVQAYLEQQSSHHGYNARVLPPVFKYRAPEPRVLKASHAAFNLTHHLVISTQQRKGLFGSVVGQSLAEYWLTVANKGRLCARPDKHCSRSRSSDCSHRAEDVVSKR